LRRKIINAALWSATQSGGQAVVSFIVFLTLVRLLDPKSFGLVAMATVFTEFVLMFQDQGFGQAIVQKQKLEDAHLDTAFWVSLVTGCLLTACGIACAGPVSRLFGEPEVEPIVRWLSLGFLIVSLASTQNAILRRALKMKQLAIRSLSATVISGIVAIAMAVSGFGLWSLVARGLVATLVESVAVWFLSDWRPSFRYRWDYFIDLFTFGASIVGKRVITLLNHRCDTFLIGLFLGPTQLGFYTVACKLIFMLKDILTGITGPVALPAFARMQQDPDRLRRAFYEATRLTAVAAFPAFLGIAAVSHELVPALYGDRWIASIPVVQILALVGLLQTILYYHTSLLVAAGKPSWNLGVKLISALCNIAAMLVSVPWGIVVVAVAQVVSNYLSAPISLLAAQNCVPFKISEYLRQCSVPLFASLTMVVVVLGLQQVPVRIPGAYGQLTLLIVLGACVYSLALKLVAPTLTGQILELIRSARPQATET
jgi:PST family polysaccharide transporter